MAQAICGCTLTAGAGKGNEPSNDAEDWVGVPVVVRGQNCHGDVGEEQPAEPEQQASGKGDRQQHGDARKTGDAQQKLNTQ